MKQVLFSLFFSLLFLIPCEALATRDGFWVSNKITFGYDQCIFLTQIDFVGHEPPRAKMDWGYIIEPNDFLDIVPRYVLQLPNSANPQAEHQFGLDLKLTLP